LAILRKARSARSSTGPPAMGWLATTVGVAGWGVGGGIVAVIGVQAALSTPARATPASTPRARRRQRPIKE
jgi:hypothetical protein